MVYRFEIGLIDGSMTHVTSGGCMRTHSSARRDRLLDGVLLNGDPAQSRFFPKKNVSQMPSATSRINHQK